MQVGSPAAALDPIYSPIGTSGRYFISSSFDEDVYIRSSAPLDVAVIPLTLTEGGLASGATALESPINTQRDRAAMHIKLETKVAHGFKKAGPIVPELPFLSLHSQFSLPFPPCPE